MEIPARALHFVFRVAKRSETMNFFRNILGMKVRLPTSQLLHSKEILKQLL